MYNIGYNEEQARNYQMWDQQKQASGDADRLWVEISDDEDNMCLDRPLFHNESGKPHHTPPLDLSSIGKVGRHVESPLDLSVKTRKRCADSTEFDDQQFAHVQLSKRMCVAQSGAVNVQAGDRRRSSVQESVIKQKFIPSENNNKPIAKMSYAGTIPSPLARASPLAYPQQHQFSTVRNQQLPQDDQSHMKQMSQAPISKMPSKPQSIQQLSQLSQYQQQMVPQKPNLKPQTYDQYQIQAGRSRVVNSKQTLTSETTALQGFYEPSHKQTLTVRGNVQSNDLGRNVVKDMNPDTRTAESRIGSDVYSRSIVPEQIMTERIAANVQRSVQTLIPSATYPPGGRARMSGNAIRSYEQPQIDISQQQHQQQQQQQEQLRQQMIIHASRDIKRANQIVDKSRAYATIPNSQKEMYLTDQERDRMAQVMKQYRRSNSRSQMVTYQTPPPHQPQPQPQHHHQQQHHQQQQQQQQQPIFHIDAQKSSRHSRNYDTSRDMRQSQLHQPEFPRRDPAMPTNVPDIQLKRDLRPGPSHGIMPTNVDFNRDFPQSASHPGSIPRGYNSDYVNTSHDTSAYSADSKVPSPRVTNRQVSQEVVHIPVRYPGPANVNSQSTRVRDNRCVSATIQGGLPKAQNEQLMQHSTHATVKHTNQHGDNGPLTIENLLSEQLSSGGAIAGKSGPGYLNATQNRSSHTNVDRRTVRLNARMFGSQFSSNMDHKQPNTRTLQTGYPYPNQSHTDQTSSRQVVAHRSPRSRLTSDSTRSSSTVSSDSIRDTTETSSSEVKRSIANIMFPAISGVTKLDHGRSIIAGTSGSKRDILDPFDAFVLDELRKDSDDTADVFKNKSVLQAFDKSANPSPTPASEHTTEHNSIKDENMSNDIENGNGVDNTSSVKSETSYVLPLHIAIPGSKPAQRNSVITTSVQDQGSNRNPKVWSRKHMILSAYKQDKDLNSIVNIDENEKIPIESSKFVAPPKRTEKDNGFANPPSPKMPILSPEEQKRHTPLVSPASRDPPTLENTTNPNRTVAKSTKEINSLEEQLHKIISDAVKGQCSFDKESVCESVYRELASQPQGHKPFLSRQTSQSKHIPVANVAPMVHARFVSENKAAYEGGEVKSETMGDDNNEENKLDPSDIEEHKASHVEMTSTRIEDNANSDAGEHIGNRNDGTEIVRKTFDIFKAIDIAMEEHDSEFSDEHILPLKTDAMSYTSNVVDNSEENELLYKVSSHAHLQDDSTRLGDGNNNDKPGISSDYNTESVSGITRRYSRTEHKDSEDDRNVFGAFNEMLVQRRASLEQRDTTVSESDENNRHTRFSKDVLAGYEGDDEDRAEKQTTKKKQSSVRQKADKLIRKAKQKKSHSSEAADILHTVPEIGSASTSPQSKGFQDGRSRSNSKNIQYSPKSRRPSFSNEDDGPVAAISDNEVFKNDESTDEEYFQNYEDEFKQFLKKQNKESSIKKPVAARKKKGLQFQLKYFSQRKKKPKGKKPRIPVASSVPLIAPSGSRQLDQLYDFEDEEFTIERPPSKPLPRRLDLEYEQEVPIPPDLKRLAVNKDTGETLLHKAARMGYEEVVLYCLTTGSVDVNARDNAGYTPLHECAVTGQTAIARHLLGHGADVNVCSIDGIRPIHDAVEYDRLETLRLLLSFGADPTLSTYAGKTLLKIARTERTRKFLTDYIADLNGCKSDTETLMPWQFRVSSSILESEADQGCAIFSGLPSDPEDETNDLCALSTKPLFPTQRITADDGKRVEDYILLADILNGYKVTRSEIEGHVPSLMLKTIGRDTFLESNKHSVFVEKYKSCASSLVEDGGFSAIRHVDSAQIISKIDKLACASKRSKM